MQSDDKNKADEHLIRSFNKLLNLFAFTFVLMAGLVVALIYYMPEERPQKVVNTPVADANGNFTEAAKQAALQDKDTTHYWLAPDLSELDGEKDKETVLLGRDLIIHTSDYFGPAGTVSKNAINGMNCQNCHLEAGTKVFGNNYSAVASTYPKYRARSGGMENIYKRVNDCFERSLNGKALDTNSKEMQAIVAYIKWLGKNVSKGVKPEGSGFKNLAFLDRAADPVKGKEAYVQKCQSCHQADGAGQMNGDHTTFTYPPLWGEHSYNTGAGLFRLSNFAKYIKYNMPLGASHNASQLSDEEAWDIAAFVNSQSRPGKNIKNDWPKIEEKPFDHPFGPYADGFSEKQHKFGPFGPIQEKIKAMQKEKKKV